MSIKRTYERRLEKWLTALVSRKYKKGEGYLAKKYLNKTPCYCALGVACEVYNKCVTKDKRLNIGYLHNMEPDNADVIFSYNNETCGLPLAVQKYFGMIDFKDNDIAEYNDETNKTFSDVKKYILRNKHRLFIWAKK